MAIEDNILDGLDLSVLDTITTSPKEEEKQETIAGEETKKEEEPGIFNPELKIQEVDELPERETEVEETPDEPKGEDTKEDTEEQVSETPEASETESTEEEELNPIRVFAELQRDQGLIDFNDDDFEDSEDWLLSKVQDTINDKVKEYKENMPEEIKYLLENYEAGVNMYDLLNIGATSQSYEKISEDSLKDNLGLQKMFYLKADGVKKELLVS